MVYLDNAATTPLDLKVLEEMLPYMKNFFGNPSSIHTHGRQAKSAIERARRNIADLINASPSEIFFNSGGTEGDNTAIIQSIKSYNISNIITTSIEHHAVLHCIEYLAIRKKVKVSYLSLDRKGNIDLEELEVLLKKDPNSLVSIMHANNELGNLNDIIKIAAICSENKAIFHSDTVQTIAHYKFDVQKNPVDFLVGSGHKFHGPKGTGFLYVNGNRKINPFILGGAQERNMRGGTENVYGILGMAKALEISYNNIESHNKHILYLKTHFIKSLSENIDGVSFNGEISNEKSLGTILNVSFPVKPDNDMLLFNLDINKISVSGGSACSSGTDIGSHVLKSLNINPKRGNVRFSFSRLNTIEEIDYTIKVLKNLYK